MTSPRFSFPAHTNRLPAAPPAEAGFVMMPLAAFGPQSAEHLAAMCRLYQIAWERTQAVLAPSKVEKLVLQPCLN